MSARCHRPAAGASQRGFTLLEAIVTLVIVSLLVTVLMQALGQAIGLRARLLRFEGETRRAVLQESWFRETVAGMQRDLFDEKAEALGTRDTLAYTTPTPLSGDGLSSVRWWLAGDALHYADARVKDVVIVEGPLRDAAFSYLDAQGEWQDAWRWQEQEGRMPKLVRFRATTARGGIDWLVPILADGQPREKLKLDVAGSNGI